MKMKALSWIPLPMFFEFLFTLATNLGSVVTRIPSGKVEAVEPLGRSLMLSAGQLGLGAQDIADVLAYVKTLK
jgi:hypothetical protein